MSDEVVTLYRPTGLRELELVKAGGYRRWPPRLAGQPFFYPVTNEDYAREITIRWNVPKDGVGFVMRFFVKKDFMDRYPIHQVGGKTHLEWWIPARDLEDLNANLAGLIEVIGEYH